MELSSDAKERLRLVFGAARIVFHVGFIPTVLYLGFKKGPEAGMPPFTIMNLLWQ